MRFRSLLVVGTASALFVPQVAHAELIYGLLNNDTAAGQQLVTFDSVTRAVTSSVLLGIGTPGNSISSIDVRPSTGQLYGYAAATRQLYTINPTNGVLTTVGSPFALGTVVSGAIDFNPSVDLIRLIGTQAGNQNYRVSPTTGAIVGTDSPLAYASGDSGEGMTPNIAANAYINNVSGASTTLLYDVDVARDVLVTQNPANSGLLQTVGPLGFNAGNTAGFGTFTGLDVSGATGAVYLTDSPAGTPPFFGGPTATTATLYSVDLASGTAVNRGLITGLPFGRSVQDIAVAGSVPEPSAIGLVAISGLVTLRRRRA